MSVWRLRSLVGNMECSSLENRFLPAESSAAAAQSAATDPQFQDSGLISAMSLTIERKTLLMELS